MWQDFYRFWISIDSVMTIIISCKGIPIQNTANYSEYSSFYVHLIVIWNNSYKTKHESLLASHDVFIFIDRVAVV